MRSFFDPLVRAIRDGFLKVKTDSILELVVQEILGGVGAPYAGRNVPFSNISMQNLKQAQQSSSTEDAICSALTNLFI